MLQRIQTIYLILGSLLLFCSFWVIPLYSCSGIDYSVYILDNWLSLACFWIFILLVLFSFNNRGLQIKLIYLLSLLCSIIILYNLYLYYISLIDALDNQKCDLNIIILPIILLAKCFYYFSIRAIKKDQDLLDSINRLR